VTGQKVAVVITSPESVGDDYTRLLHLAGYGNALRGDRNTVLGIDQSWHHYFPACSSPPWQIDGVLGTLLRDGFRKDAVFPCIHGTAGLRPSIGEILNRQGYAAEKHGMTVRRFDGSEARVRYVPETELRVLGEVFPEGMDIPEVLFGSNLVLLPTMKTHVAATLAGAFHTLFGVILNEKRRLALHRLDEAMVDVLAVAGEILAGMFVVMDGTFAGEGPGPCRLLPHAKNVILASSDPVALDAFAAYVMGFDPLSIPYIRLAHESGLGVGDIRELEAAGDDVRGMRLGFEVRPTALDSFLWKCERCTGLPFVHRASIIYNDFYWYVAVAEKRIAEAMKTGWGEVFESYRKRG